MAQFPPSAAAQPIDGPPSDWEPVTGSASLNVGYTALMFMGDAEATVEVRMQGSGTSTRSFTLSSFAIIPGLFTEIVDKTGTGTVFGGKSKSN